MIPSSSKHLRSVAESWVGTPFRADCMVKGQHGGIDCKLLAVAVVTEWLGLSAAAPEHFAKKRQRFIDDGVVLRALEDFFCQRHELYAPLTCTGVLVFRAGDILGLGRGNLGHVVVMLDERSAVHVVRGRQCLIEPIQIIQSRMELKYCYRLKEGS